MTALIVIEYHRNMDSHIADKLFKYGISWRDERYDKRGSKTHYMVVMTVHESGTITAATLPVPKDKKVPEIYQDLGYSHVIYWKGTSTALDNLPSKLQLLGIYARWVYGKAKNAARNL